MVEPYNQLLYWVIAENISNETHSQTKRLVDGWSCEPATHQKAEEGLFTLRCDCGMRLNPEGLLSTVR